MCCDTCCYKNMDTCLGFAWSKQLGCMKGMKQSNRALLGSADRGIGVFEIMGVHAMCNEVSHATVAPRAFGNYLFGRDFFDASFYSFSCDLSTLLLSNHDHHDHNNHNDDLDHNYDHDDHAANNHKGCRGDDYEEA